jgi:hypothetical protein
MGITFFISNLKYESDFTHSHTHVCAETDTHMVTHANSKGVVKITYLCIHAGA